ncbi:MAG: SGNH/GDSL hydrolase family protein [Clostridia bacterium]|nr:SGNH/GDSL hydrolase family protein [Clostridia bacterium]
MKIELKKQDRICFLGDSITAHGIWEAEVIEYFLQNRRELGIEFFNCGISGSQGRYAELKGRLYCDFLNYFPRYVVILFGANDVGRHLYDPAKETPELIKEREDRVVGYGAALRRIVCVCRERGITPIICTPTPYDEYNDPPEQPWNIDEGLSKFADAAREIAEENGLLLIDMRALFVEHIKERPICVDRLHPNAYGYHLMAEKFLFDIGAKDSIEPDRIPVISEKNKKRFEVEDILRDIIFVDRDYMGWQYEEKSFSLQRRKALLKKRIESDPRDFSRVLKTYVKYADVKDELQGELLKRTIEMYK